jgi:hypothetical protein
VKKSGFFSNNVEIIHEEEKEKEMNEELCIESNLKENDMFEHIPLKEQSFYSAPSINDKDLNYFAHSPLDTLAFEDNFKKSLLFTNNLPMINTINSHNPMAMANELNQSQNDLLNPLNAFNNNVNNNNQNSASPNMNMFGNNSSDMLYKKLVENNNLLKKIYQKSRKSTFSKKDGNEKNNLKRINEKVETNHMLINSLMQNQFIINNKRGREETQTQIHMNQVSQQVNNMNNNNVVNTVNTVNATQSGGNINTNTQNTSNSVPGFINPNIALLIPQGALGNTSGGNVGFITLDRSTLMNSELSKNLAFLNCILPTQGMPNNVSGGGTPSGGENIKKNID